VAQRDARIPLTGRFVLSVNYTQKGALTRLRNDVYKKNAETIKNLEEKLLLEVAQLQAEVNQRLSDMPLGPSR
jgi:hypothetical protein